MSSPIAATPPDRAPAARMAQVTDRAQRLRVLFEMEREFARTVSALIPRLGSLEIKFLVAQHAWEAMDHARYLRERGRELAGFGAGDAVRAGVSRLFTEALCEADASVALAGFYRVLKPALLQAYLQYQRESDGLADWPTRKLIDEFMADEHRHATEMKPHLSGAGADAWCEHLWEGLLQTPELAAVAGGDDSPGAPLAWRSAGAPYRHPGVPARMEVTQCNSVFGDDPEVHIVHDGTFRDPATEAGVIRLMIYVWLMNELTAVETLATVHFDTPELPLETHLDLARHVWDEARHTQFGYRQLRRLGVDLKRLNIHDLPYQTYQKITPAERYARLTCVAEAESFEIKGHIMDRVRELNDFEADTLLAFDRSDEQSHVRYGHRWVPTLMKREKIEMPMPDFVAHARARFDQAQAALRRQPEIAATLRDSNQYSANGLKALWAEMQERSRQRG